MPQSYGMRRPYNGGSVPKRKITGTRRPNDSQIQRTAQNAAPSGPGVPGPSGPTGANAGPSKYNAGPFVPLPYTPGSLTGVNGITTLPYKPGTAVGGLIPLAKGQQEAAVQDPRSILERPLSQYGVNEAQPGPLNGGLLFRGAPGVQRPPSGPGALGLGPDGMPMPPGQRPPVMGADQGPVGPDGMPLPPAQGPPPMGADRGPIGPDGMPVPPDRTAQVPLINSGAPSLQDQARRRIMLDRELGLGETMDVPDIVNQSPAQIVANSGRVDPVARREAARRGTHSGSILRGGSQSRVDLEGLGDLKFGGENIEVKPTPESLMNKSYGASNHPILSRRYPSIEQVRKIREENDMYDDNGRYTGPMTPEVRESKSYLAPEVRDRLESAKSKLGPGLSPERAQELRDDNTRRRLGRKLGLNPNEHTIEEMQGMYNQQIGQRKIDRGKNVVSRGMRRHGASEADIQRTLKGMNRDNAYDTRAREHGIGIEEQRDRLELDPNYNRQQMVNEELKKALRGGAGGPGDNPYDLGIGSGPSSAGPPGVSGPGGGILTREDMRDVFGGALHGGNYGKILERETAEADRAQSMKIAQLENEYRSKDMQLRREIANETNALKKQELEVQRQQNANQLALLEQQGAQALERDTMQHKETMSKLDVENSIREEQNRIRRNENPEDRERNFIQQELESGEPGPYLDTALQQVWDEEKEQFWTNPNNPWYRNQNWQIFLDSALTRIPYDKGDPAQVQKAMKIAEKWFRRNVGTTESKWLWDTGPQRGWGRGK